MCVLLRVRTIIKKVSLVTFATYVLTSEANQLSVEKVLVSLTLFDIMKIPLTVLPMLSVDIAEVRLIGDQSMMMMMTESSPTLRLWCITDSPKSISLQSQTSGSRTAIFSNALNHIVYYFFVGLISHIRHLRSNR